jgi:hypothetical protein
VLRYASTDSEIGTRYWGWDYLFPPGLNAGPVNTTGIDVNATYIDIVYGNVTFGNRTIEIDGAGGSLLGVM